MQTEYDAMSMMTKRDGEVNGQAFVYAGTAALALSCTTVPAQEQPCPLGANKDVVI